MVDGEEVCAISEAIGVATNNVAEYRALQAAVQKAHDMGYQKLIINADSELMIKQLKGEYKVKNQELKKYFDAIKINLAEFDSYALNHVPREQNKRADSLANLAL